MRSGPTVTRRQALLAGAVTTAAAAGCSSPSNNRPTPSMAPKPSAASTQSAVDKRLRDRAIADERRLLAASVGRQQAEPFASIHTMHLRHLEELTGSRTFAGAGKPAAPAVLAAAERKAASARRGDCLTASSTLAPLLASIAAASEIAAVLLAS